MGVRNRIVGSGVEKLENILFNPRNWRIHPLNQQNALNGVLDEVGWVQEVIVNQRTGNLVDGHLRCQLAARKGEKEIPVKYVDLSEEEEALVLATIDPIAAMAATDKGKLDELFTSIQSDNAEVNKMLDEIAEKEQLHQQRKEPYKTLAERFVVPPFSVLDSRQGYWQDRKRAWISIGIESELGRGASPGGSPRDAATLENGHTVRGNGKGQKMPAAEDFGSGSPGDLASSYKNQSRLSALQKGYKKEDTGLLGESKQALTHYKASTVSTTTLNDWAGGESARHESGTSIFDPVLCEIIYRWFCIKSGKVLDPFAGGSVRGIVASVLGLDYTGIDLSKRQIEANIEQGITITPDRQPKWIIGDAQDCKELAPGEYDLIFSCPPYANLEVYSNDPNDLSTMDYPEFKTAYHEIISKCVSMLKDNRFACFVVGDVRDSKGFYYNFPANTINAFQDAGMTLYNEAVLITAAGSLPIRASAAFPPYRKLGKTHQNVLIFYKGDPKAIKDFGDCECGDGDAIDAI
jgi:hypothetical protein